MKLFYYIFGVLLLIILFLAIIGLIPIIKVVPNKEYKKNRELLPLHVAYFVDNNIIDLKHIH